MLARLSFAFLSLLLLSCGRRPPPPHLWLQLLPPDPVVPANAVLEISLRHNGDYANKFLDVSIDAVLTSPEGIHHRVRGFFFQHDVWKIRWRPSAPGRWTYTYRMTANTGFHAAGQGAFDCLPPHASTQDQAPLVRNPHNPFRWTLTGGRPYFPLGLQDCVGPGRLSPVDGGARSEPGRSITPDQYLALYAGAGFNLFRFSQRNCSYSLYDDLDHYREAESLATDELLSLARKHGLRVMFGFFGYHGQWAQGNRLQRGLTRLAAVLRPQEALLDPDDHVTTAKEKRFLEYCIARWGVYADFWELLNERKASDQWTTLMASHVRSADPDRKPVATSWEKPELTAIDINAPHWYVGEHELQSDLRVRDQAAKWKLHGKPVIVGEHGNSGMNWDPRSALRMRIRIWTALFQDIGLVFWNTSWSKAGMHGGRFSPGEASNIYLGPEERGYTRIFRDFCSRLDAAVAMSPLDVSPRSQIRAYGLLSERVAAAYLHHSTSHSAAVEGATITLTLPPSRPGDEPLLGEWIDPATGAVLSRLPLTHGLRTLAVPPFAVDLAFVAAPAPRRGGSSSPASTNTL